MNRQTEPLVSVIMPVFNAQRFLEQAIHSILEQTHQNFELIIVDDGSKDESWDIATRLGKADARIHLIQLPKNQGISATCNTGLKMAKGKYIARMDADDVSLPDRLSRQVEFMETHPDIGVLGGGMRYMAESGELLGSPPQFFGDLAIRWNLFFETPFFHPTVILRKSLLDEYGLQYDPSYSRGVEDYELWSRILPVTRGENLADIVLHYRLHPNSNSHRHVNLEHENVITISARAIKSCLPDAAISLQEVVDLQKALVGGLSFEKRQRARRIQVYFKIWDEFRQIHAGEAGLEKLQQGVIAWAARMILYPPFQPHVSGALALLTKRDWRWPLYLLSSVPYYWKRRQIS
jgi:glycosyltransferase involved in cell wall biosynthesis